MIGAIAGDAVGFCFECLPRKSVGVEAVAPAVSRSAQWHPKRPRRPSLRSGGGVKAEVLELARQTALPTHGHERGIVGAQAVALATWLAGQGADAAEIRSRVTAVSGYDLSRTVDEIRPGYRFDVSCDGSVPEAIICALEASSWEDAVRLAVSLGGDADTQAAIAGGIAGAGFGVDSEVVAEVTARLDEVLGGVVGEFVGDLGAGEERSRGMA